MAEMIESRIAVFNGRILTECVKKTNGLLETEIKLKIRFLDKSINWGLETYFYYKLV